MATWKKVTVSGSDSHLNSLSVGSVGVSSTFGAAAPSSITASNKLFALTDEGVTNGDMDKVVIVTSTNGINEFLFTSSAAITTDVSLLEFNAGISGSLKKAPTGTGWSGSDAGTITVDTGSLSGAGITSTGTDEKFAVLADPTPNNIAVGNGGVSVNKTNLVAGLKGLEVSGNTIRVKVDDTTTGLNADGKLSASIATVAHALEDGNGIADFDYNGSSTATIAINTSQLRGQGITTDGTNNVLTINSGSGAAIDGNNILKFGSSQFQTMSISDDGANAISIGTDTYTTSILGGLTVEGTATFASETDLNVADKFILLNSGSGRTLTDDFGFAGQTGSFAGNEGTGFAYDGDKRWVMTKNALGNATTPASGGFGTELGAIPLLVDTTDVGTADTFFNQKGNMLREDANNFYIYVP